MRVEECFKVVASRLQFGIGRRRKDGVDKGTRMKVCFVLLESERKAIYWSMTIAQVA